MLDYKMLLNKGFTPNWYTNSYFKEDGTNRLFYGLENISMTLFTSIMSALDLWNEYFNVINTDDLEIEIEVTESLDEVCIYFNGSDFDNLVLNESQIYLLFKVLPDKYTFKDADY